jgi:hypothetical protein
MLNYCLQQSSSSVLPLQDIAQDFQTFIDRSSSHSNTIEAFYNNYWQIVYNILLCCDLDLLCVALSCHSELYALLHEEDYVMVNNDGSATDKYCCLQLFNLIRSHPYSYLLREEDIEDTIDAKCFDFHVTSSKWRTEIEDFRRNRAMLSLLTKVPQLDMVLRVLSGEKEAIRAIIGKNKKYVSFFSFFFYLAISL